MIIGLMYVMCLINYIYNLKLEKISTSRHIYVSKVILKKCMQYIKQNLKHKYKSDTNYKNFNNNYSIAYSERYLHIKNNHHISLQIK